MFYFMIALKAVDVLYGFGYHASSVCFLSWSRYTHPVPCCSLSTSDTSAAYYASMKRIVSRRKPTKQRWTGAKG